MTTLSEVLRSFSLPYQEDAEVMLYITTETLVSSFQFSKSKSFFIRRYVVSSNDIPGK
jgi:hypothetical protein